MHTARLFLAIDLNEQVIARLAGIQGVLEGLYRGARWVKPEGMHVTLKFFGKLPLREVYEISNGIKGVAGRHEAFRCDISGIGGFPSLGRPRVLWAGVGANIELVQQVAMEVLAEMEARGYGAEERQFVPHITLARFKDRREYDEGNVETLLPRYDRYEFGSTDIERLVLYSSELTPAGPIYTRVDSWELGRA